MLAKGFADPVASSQRVFRAVMRAMSRPALPVDLDAGLAPPAPLSPELAALSLTLADPDAPLWLDPDLAAAAKVREYLVFHTGARIVADPAAAAFALVSRAEAMPAFTAFAQGTDAYPDRSTTLLLAVARLTAGRDLVFTGPGIPATAGLSAAPLPPDLAAQLRDNRARFPRGVDLVLAGPGRIAGIPRSSALVPEAA